MKVLVTGANGLLGHHIVNELLHRQYRVKIILRKNAEVYFDLGQTEVVYGNFSDPIDFEKAATDCDAVIHTAAVTGTHYRTKQPYTAINYEAVANIIQILEKLNISNLIFVSSVNTIGYGTAEKNADENGTIAYPFTHSWYAQTKLEAEKLVESFGKREGRRSILLNPAFMLGSMDTKPSSGKLLLMGYQKKLMFVPKGGKNFVPAVSVAKACVNALEKGRSSERYLLCGENLSFQQFYLRLSKIGRYRQTIIKLPDLTLKIAGKIGDFIQKLGLETDLCTRNTEQLIIREYYSSRKAETELNFKCGDIEDAIQESIEWFKSTGKIKPDSHN